MFWIGTPLQYTDSTIEVDYPYRTTRVEVDENGDYVLTPKEIVYQFRTERNVPRLGLMLVGWGGNNGSTITAGIIANREYASLLNDIYEYSYLLFYSVLRIYDVWVTLYLLLYMLGFFLIGRGISWRTKSGIQEPNYFGSLTQASTIRVGLTPDGQDVNIPLKDLVPMVESYFICFPIFLSLFMSLCPFFYQVFSSVFVSLVGGSERLGY